MPIPSNPPIKATLQAGQTQTFSNAGSSFVVVLLSGGFLNIRPIGANIGTPFPYPQGTGENLLDGSQFSALEVSNPNAFAVSFVLRVGSVGFIDRRLYPNPIASTVQIVTTEATDSNAVITKSLPDLSGTIVGGFYILQRKKISFVVELANNAQASFQAAFLNQAGGKEDNFPFYLTQGSGAGATIQNSAIYPGGSGTIYLTSNPFATGTTQAFATEYYEAVSPSAIATI